MHHVEWVVPGTNYLIRILDGHIDTQGPIQDLQAWGILENIMLLQVCGGGVVDPGRSILLVFKSPVRSGFFMPQGFNRNRNRSAFLPGVKKTRPEHQF